MRIEYTAIVKQQGDWWIGWIGEVPGVNCQEHSYQELLETLRVTLQEAIEFNRKDAIAGHDAALKDRFPSTGTPQLSFQRNAVYPAGIKRPVIKDSTR